MGGIGSGPRRRKAPASLGEGSASASEAGRAPRRTTDQLPSLDVRDLKRAGLIAPGQERVGVVARFRLKRSTALGEAPASPGAESDSDARVVELAAPNLPLTWTPCNYGGCRPWFLCPGCGRRVAILYGPAELGPPLCRLCRDLTYQSKFRGSQGKHMGA